MIYTHVLNRGGKGVTSPSDRLWQRRNHVDSINRPFRTTGAKKLLRQYGDRLVCMRYRYDEQRQLRMKTIELVVEEEAWTPTRAQFQKEDIVAIRLTPSEVGFHRQVKQCGGRWDPQCGVWELQYRHAVALRLADRIVQ